MLKTDWVVLDGLLINLNHVASIAISDDEGCVVLFSDGTVNALSEEDTKTLLNVMSKRLEVTL